MVEVMTLEERGLKNLSDFMCLVDAAFIAEKCRTGSLSRRYPGLFQSDNRRNLYGAWLDDHLVATTAVREVTAANDVNPLKIAMVGFVSVTITQRGSGIGSRIIEVVSRDLIKRNVDLAVLWTTSPAFYQRFDWIPCDHGALGIFHSNHKSNFPLIHRKPSEVVKEIECIREYWQVYRLRRTPVDYLTVPASVDGVICTMTGNDPSVDAYAIVGVKDKTAFIYELVGNPSRFRSLWNNIAGRFTTVFVNECNGSQSMEWLEKNTALTWTSQTLAMWLATDAWRKLKKEPIYVPFFDRI